MIKDILLEYCREKGLRLKDLRKELLDLALDLYDTSDLDSKWGKDYDLSDQRHKDLSEFHQHLIQETIDFVNGNPGIKEMIQSKKSEVTRKLEEEGYSYTPGTRVYFWADGLDDSLEEGKWTPSTDSSLGIYIGDTNVILDA